MARHAHLHRGAAALLAIACLSISVTPSVCLAAESEASEAAVQAAYLFNFARFTEWPAGTFANKNTPLMYCLLGRRDTLANAMVGLNDRLVQGHPLRFAQPERLEDARNCHLVFVAEPDSKRRAQALQFLATQPTLTVSDFDGFTHEGGMIRLMQVGTRLRFEINRSDTQKAGLKLAADLLNLATTIVEPETGSSR